MRKALEGSGRVVQIGMQMISNRALTKVREVLCLGPYGSHHGDQRAPLPERALRRVDASRFLPTAMPRTSIGRRSKGRPSRYPFDPQRYRNWRFFWDYSGGNVFENMIHQVGYWYKALDLKIPEAVTMTGGNYLSPKMQVPDTMNVTMLQPEKIVFNWNSMFGNDYYGEGHDLLLGNKGTLTHTETDEVRFLPQGQKSTAVKQESSASSGKAPDIVGYSDATDRHMQDFFNCMRSRKEPICPFEIGYRSAIACQMAVASYRQGEP